VLRRSLWPKVDAVLGTTHRDPEDHPYPIALAALVAGWALVSSSVTTFQYWFPSWSEGPLILFMPMWIAGALVIAAVRARQFRDRVDPPLADARFLRHWFVAFGAVVVALAMLSPPMAPLELAAHFLGALTLAAMVAWSAWPKDRARGIALRKRIAEARGYFQAQLRTRQPQLDDAWHPYLIALGLAPQVDSWFAAYGRAPQREKQDEDSSPGSSRVAFDAAKSSRAEDAEPVRWTGGGGRSGGAGASGSWGSAAAGLASPISTASSSSSSASSRSDSSAGSSATGESTSRSGGGSAGGW
jgi:uncharacterized membrane protein YgcG